MGLSKQNTHTHTRVPKASRHVDTQSGPEPHGPTPADNHPNHARWYAQTTHLLSPMPVHTAHTVLHIRSTDTGLGTLPYPCEAMCCLRPVSTLTNTHTPLRSASVHMHLTDRAQLNAHNERMRSLVSGATAEMQQRFMAAAAAAVASSRSVACHSCYSCAWPCTCGMQVTQGLTPAAAAVLHPAGTRQDLYIGAWLHAKSSMTPAAFGPRAMRRQWQTH